MPICAGVLGYLFCGKVNVSYTCHGGIGVRITMRAPSLLFVLQAYCPCQAFMVFDLLWGFGGASGRNLLHENSTKKIAFHR